MRTLRFIPTAVLLTVLLALALPAAAATRIWLGDSTLWSDPDNWSPNGAPQDGDFLSFPNNPGITAMNNDLPNLIVNNMTFTGGSYTLSGQPLTFIQGITDNHSSSGTNRINCNVQFVNGGGVFATLNTGQLEINGTTTLANNDNLNLTASLTNITVNGVIQGNGGLLKRGEAAVFLRGSGANTYNGPTRIEGGDLHLAKPSAVRAISPIVVIDGFNPGTPSLSDDLPGQYPPLLSMTMTNGGTWHITNGATVTNLTLSSYSSISGSGLLTLQCDVIVARGVGGSFVHDTFISCPIYLGDQTRTFDVRENFDGNLDLSIFNVIIGPGPGPGSSGIIKDGSGDMILYENNIYFGPTRVKRGELVVTQNGSLGGSGIGAETIVEGALTFSGTLSVPEPLIVDDGSINFGSATLTGPVIVSNYVYLIGFSGTSLLNITNVISGPGTFVLYAGTLRLSGSAPNTFGRSGDVLLLYPVVESDATLELAKLDNVVAVPIPVQLNAPTTNQAVLRNFQHGGVAEVRIGHGGSWQLNGRIVAPTALTFIGDGFVDTQGGLLSLTNPNTNQLRVLPSSPVSNYIAEIFGRFSCDAVSNMVFVDSNLTLNVAARVGGAAQIVKEGLGTLRLSVSNNFTGPLLVNAGTLVTAHNDALGGIAAGEFVNRNGSLALEGGITVGFEPLTLDTTNAAGLTSLGPITNTWRGNVTLQRTAGINVPDPAGVLRFDSFFGCCPSFITGPGGITKSGPGAVVISGTVANNFTGPTTVNDGLLEASRTQGAALSSNVVVSGANSVLRTGRPAASTALPPASSMTVQNGGLWTMNTANTETLSRLVGNGDLEIGSGAALTVSNDVSCTFSGAVSGSGLLNKRGPATLQFSGQSPSYTGAATVFDGTYMVDGYFATSPVTVKISAILRGGGAVGDVTVETGGVLRVDPHNAGLLGGAMQFNSVNFQGGGILGAGFYGPNPTGGNDQLYVLNGVTLNLPSLSSGFQYPPHEGDVIKLIDKIGAGPIVGSFSGFVQGGVTTIGQVPVVTSYVGGDGNDMTLTVTNLPLAGGGSTLVSGNLGSVLVPNDCSLLSLVVTNRGGTTISNLRGTLRSLTEGVVVTIGESTFPNLPVNARGTNVTPFQVRTTPEFPCGATAQFELVLTGSNTPTTAVIYTLLGASGYALELDGNDDQVDIPANTFSGIVNNFTIELWANPFANRSQTPETNAGISGVSIPLHQLQRFAVFPDAGNFAYGLTHVGAGLSIGRNGISVYENGTNHLPSRLVYTNDVSGWTHVALVYASRQPRLYVNGVLVRSGSASVFPNVHPSGSLGGSTQADYGNFDGQLDEVRIWNSALTQSQIQSNMTRSLTGSEAGLLTYFRCDAGSGSTLVDSASASPNPTGTLADDAAFVLSDRGPFTLPGGPACDSGGGACESCFVFSGTFTTNTPTLTVPLSPEGSPSLCFPAKPCPGPFPVALPPTPYLLHTFANTSGTQACVTAQLHFDCPAAPNGAMFAAAYLGAFDPLDPCKNYLGDCGGDSTVPFSFQAPAGSNIVIVVTSWTPGIGCDAYTLELFGLPCPPPTLAISREAGPQQVRVHWSTAYPGFTAQQAGQANGAFVNVPQSPAMLNGRYALTNIPATTNRFYRLKK